ncbi:MAG TPA: hypothetical protein VGR06_03680 [Actinophytocola sp.]|jgi:hypothetical protein|uniref:hypothetical protein n=1 Tax=Actinophytocola sp. TaxID=1872138 RepID=UPI002DFB0E32|nr:hypothetical protein [Actinophytocola sp.]
MAGHYLAKELGLAGDGTLTLCPSYEEARAMVADGRATRLLVANAYHGISEFYMDPWLTLERAFVFDTPLYGLASRRRSPLPLQCTIVTHPAPIPLINQLIPPGYGVSTVGTAASTSAAAAQVAAGGADLALTTEPAARRYGLQFISPTRPIRMLWSVFVPIREDERLRLSTPEENLGPRPGDRQPWARTTLPAPKEPRDA